MLADLGDMAPRQLKMRAPKKISRDAPPEGQFVWHQSRTAGVSYFTHLLSWALSRSALSATTDASTTQRKQHCVRDLRAATPHRNHRSTCHRPAAVLHLVEELLEESIMSLNSMPPCSQAHLEDMPQGFRPPACVAPSVRLGSTQSGSLLSGHGCRSYLQGVYEISSC